jgi:hypothetical protein
MGLKVVPRKKKATLTPLQQKVMRGYKKGGLVKANTGTKARKKRAKTYSNRRK